METYTLRFGMQKENSGRNEALPGHFRGQTGGVLSALVSRVTGNSLRFYLYNYRFTLSCFSDRPGKRGENIPAPKT